MSNNTKSTNVKFSKNQSIMQNKINSTIDNLHLKDSDKVKVNVESINKSTSDIQIKYGVKIEAKKLKKYSFVVFVEQIVGSNSIKSVEFEVYCITTGVKKSFLSKVAPYKFSGECNDSVKCDFIVNWASNVKTSNGKLAQLLSLNSGVLGTNKVGSIVDIFNLN